MNDKILAMLMASFPSQESKDELKATMAAYDLALDGIAAEFVECAAKAFIQGRVSFHNSSFRPRPTELASFARKLQGKEMELRKMEASRKLQLENRGRDEPTPEEKAAVQKRLAEFKQLVALVSDQNKM